MLKKKLANTKENRIYLNSLPDIYLIGYWARYGYSVFPFTGKYEYDPYLKIKVPLVYQYDDCNGTCDYYWLRRITDTTTGGFKGWVSNKTLAIAAVDSLNKEGEKYV